MAQRPLFAGNGLRLRAAYAMGSVIRYNIRNAEPPLRRVTRRRALRYERTANLALVIAYDLGLSLHPHTRRFSVRRIGSQHTSTREHPDC